MRPDENTLAYFIEDLASSSPAPGGGGAAALCGALGAALASMVANLTAGKKKYAQYEEDIQRISGEAQKLSSELLGCIEEDETCFVPLSRAYGIPKEDPRRDEIMEEALRAACTAPLHIMKLSARAIELHSELIKKGSALMISDVGAGVQCCRAALLGGSLNIRININMMKDRDYAARLQDETGGLVKTYAQMADGIYEEVIRKIS